MKRYALSVVFVQLCFVVNVAASEEGQLQKCSDKNEIDVSTKDRLPFNGSGTVYEFKFPSGTNTIKINEEKRQLRIAEEVSTIIKTVSGDAVQLMTAGENLCATYTQKYKRSNIKITALDKDQKELVSRTLVAGPEENWYLSADLPISNIKQLTYDSSTNSVVEKEKPATFYLGVNYQLGDVFEVSEWYKKFSVKFMLKASSKPSESYGIGIGYSFEAVDVFAARLRTKDDSNIGGASLGYTDATVFGVSFNISKGLAWVNK